MGRPIKLITSLLLNLNCWLAFTQDTIYLKNPSFEDTPRKGGDFAKPIVGWYDCGLIYFPGETPPDIHPVPTKAWEVSNTAHDGNTYLGLVGRFNNTYESVSQELDHPLEPNKCYTFSLYMCISESYKSRTSRSRDFPENFTEPMVLRIWGGNKYCKKDRLLGESAPIANTDWKKFDFLFYPGNEFGFITLEAYFDVEKVTVYNGHILIDKLSPIIEIPCD